MTQWLLGEGENGKGINSDSLIEATNETLYQVSGYQLNDVDREMTKE